MQLKKDYKNVVCVYKITCKPNGKILIGSTTNLYSRINHYRNDVNKDNPLKHYNKAFYDDLIKYGITCFIVDIVEQFDDISAIELKNKETYYMNLFNSLDSNTYFLLNNIFEGGQLSKKIDSYIRDNYVKVSTFDDFILYKRG